LFVNEVANAYYTNEFESTPLKCGLNLFLKKLQQKRIKKIF
jgi:hypothetical protein